MIKDSRYLTKSRFKSALECPTKLYYAGKDDYADNSKEDKFLSALAEGGYQVGELSKYYHPDGKEVSSEKDYDSQLKKTSELLQSEKVIIHEPAIKFENFFIRVDILVKDGTAVDLIEVKAKSFRSENEFYSSRGYISSSWRPYLYDVAFQTWVTESAFPDWTVTPFLMLADKNKKASIDGLNQYFTVNEDITREDALKVETSIADKALGETLLTKINVKKAVDMIRKGQDKDPKRKSIEEKKKDLISRATEYSEYYEKDEKYSVSLGSKCKSCEFKNKDALELKSGYEECWSEVFPEFDSKAPHIFDIARFNKKKSDLLIKRGLYRLDHIHNDQELINELKLNPRQIMQINKTVDDAKDEYIDSKLYEELDQWIFPLHFIDFETSVVAIPFHKNRSPYEQIAFQFSCHTYHENGDIEHHEWIESEKGKFPNFDFVKNLKKVLDKDNGTILRYATHENTVLRQIQDQMIDESENDYKELINWIDTVTEWDDGGDRVEGDRNMKDMLKLVKDHYYHKRMGGSNSIKSVLPSILTISDHIKKKYSKPVGYGNNLSDQVMWQMNDSTGKPHDPYKILPDTYQGLDLPKGKTLFKDAKVQDGSGALIAYGKLQFTEMLEEEKEALIHALKQYCELDTLAMVFIYEHWLSVKEDIC